MIISLLEKFRHYRIKKRYDKYSMKMSKIRRKYSLGKINKDYIYISKIIGVYYTKLKKILFKVLYVYPVKNNKIIFIAYEGRQYSCNPKLVSEYLANKYGDELDIVWIFNTPHKFTKLDKNIRIVKNGTFECVKELLTAKVFLSNMRIVEDIPFRKNQVRISTGHGGGAYKHLLLDIPGITSKDRQKIMFSTNNTTLFVSTNKRYTECVVRGAYNYSGEVLECGMPRNDIFFNDKTSNAVRDYYDISSETKILLYAPTYRAGRKKFDYELDSERLLNSLTTRFGGEWVIIYRLHHFIKGKIGYEASKKGIIDATNYKDMQELLMESDILITDYSSCMWDYTLTGKPGFLYAPDLENYIDKQGFYTEISEWPFYLAENNEELEECILTFDEEDYQKRVNKHHTELEMTETGNATQIIAERIYNSCKGVI